MKLLISKKTRTSERAKNKKRPMTRKSPILSNLGPGIWNLEKTRDHLSLLTKMMVQAAISLWQGDFAKSMTFCKRISSRNSKLACFWTNSNNASISWKCTKMTRTNGFMSTRPLSPNRKTMSKQSQKGSWWDSTECSVRSTSRNHIESISTSTHDIIISFPTTTIRSSKLLFAIFLKSLKR